jgi:hypothetical protein
MHICVKHVVARCALAHEAAHYLANHQNGDNRQDAEVIAESAAFVALDHFGINTENSTFSYVAGWAGDMTRIRANLTDVQRIANVLISAIEGTSVQGEHDAEPILASSKE